MQILWLVDRIADVPLRAEYFHDWIPVPSKGKRVETEILGS